MKKILLSLTLLLFIVSGNAQDKMMTIGLGFGAGSVNSSAVNVDDANKNVGVGFDFYANFLYNINYNISAGIELNSTIAIIALIDDQSAEVTSMMNFLAKGKYAFGKERRNSGARFFVAGSIGLYGIKPSAVITEDNANLSFTLDRKYSFGGAPEVGVQFGVFQMALAYHFAGKYEFDNVGKEFKYSMIMFNIGWNIGVGDK